MWLCVTGSCVGVCVCVFVLFVRGCACVCFCGVCVCVSLCSHACYLNYLLVCVHVVCVYWFACASVHRCSVVVLFASLCDVVFVCACLWVCACRFTGYCSKFLVYCLLLTHQ